MSSEQPWIERRQHVRARVCGDVMLRSGGGREVHGRAVVVSVTTLEVTCQLGFSLLAMAGMSVEIEMRLDGHSTWFWFHGQVARVRAADHSLVIAVAALPAELAALVAGAGEVAPIEVMVVDDDRGRRARISDAFRAEGCHVVEVSSTSDALAALSDAPIATEVIAVADTDPDTAAVELRSYLEANAHAMVVGIGGVEWIPSGARLDPEDPLADLRSRVHSLLLQRPV